MRRAAQIELTPEEESVLSATARSRRSSVREAERARIILLAAAELTNKEIATKLGTGEPVVGRWRKRFAEDRLAGLTEKAGRGRKPRYGARKVKKIVDATVKSTPAQATHWSTRTMARQAGVSHTTVRRIWNAHQLKPHLVRTFKLSNDKRFTEKLRDIVGLYLNPPEHALVLCVDEKSQIQALDA